MLRTLKLLLPALLPSWRFFDTIAASPRIQYALLNTENEVPSDWHEFRPRPAQLSFMQMLRRMFWNPRWNESLFMVSCAERLMQNPTRHSEDEILNRITNELMSNSSTTHATPATPATQIQFRLIYVHRQGSQLQQLVTFYSRIQTLPARDAA